MGPERIQRLRLQAAVSLNGNTALWKAACLVFQNIGLDHFCASHMTYQQNIGFSSNDLSSIDNICRQLFGENHQFWGVFLKTLLNMKAECSPAAIVGFLCHKLSVFYHHLPRMDFLDTISFIEAVETATMMVCRCGEMFGEDSYLCTCEQTCWVCDKYFVPSFEEKDDNLCKCTQADYDEQYMYDGCCNICDGLGCLCEEYL